MYLYFTLREFAHTHFHLHMYADGIFALPSHSFLILLQFLCSIFGRFSDTLVKLPGCLLWRRDNVTLPFIYAYIYTFHCSILFVWHWESQLEVRTTQSAAVYQMWRHVFIKCDIDVMNFGDALKVLSWCFFCFVNLLFCVYYFLIF